MVALRRSRKQHRHTMTNIQQKSPDDVISPDHFEEYDRRRKVIRYKLHECQIRLHIVNNLRDFEVGAYESRVTDRENWMYVCSRSLLWSTVLDFSMIVKDQGGKEERVEEYASISRFKNRMKEDLLKTENLVSEWGRLVKRHRDGETFTDRVKRLSDTIADLRDHVVAHQADYVAENLFEEGDIPGIPPLKMWDIWDEISELTGLFYFGNDFNPGHDVFDYKSTERPGIDELSKLLRKISKHPEWLDLLYEIAD